MSVEERLALLKKLKGKDGGPDTKENIEKKIRQVYITQFERLAKIKKEIAEQQKLKNLQ